MSLSTFFLCLLPAIIGCVFCPGCGVKGDPVPYVSTERPAEKQPQKKTGQENER